MLLHAERFITTIPRGPGLNKKQSATAAHPLRLSSIFPQGTAPSQPSSIMHHNPRYKSPQIEQSVRYDKEQSTKGRGNQSTKIPRMKNIPLCSLMSFFVFLCLCCYLSCMFTSLVGCSPRRESSVILIGCV